MGIFGRRDDESMDPQELLARGHAEMAESSADDDAPSGTTSAFRLTVVDVFVIKGRGTVVTGVVETGTVQDGWPVSVERDGQVVARAVITGIEQFRKRMGEAGPGENVGLLLSDLDLSSVRAGDIITN